MSRAQNKVRHTRKDITRTKRRPKPPQGFRVPAPKPKEVEEIKTVFMCGVNWQHEFQDVPDQVRVFDAIEDLKEKVSCWERCGIVELEVRLVRWVKEQSL